MRNELWLSVRYLFSRRRGSASALMNVLSILGTATGVMALIVVISVMSGFSQNLQDKILGVTPHITIFHRNGEISDYERITTRLAEMPGIKAASPFILREVVLQGPIGGAGVVLKAVDLKSTQVRSFLSKILAQGSLEGLASEKAGRRPGIILGKWLVDKLGCQIGQSVVLISPEGTLTPWGNLPKWRRLQVAGIFESGYWEFDSKVAYISLATAQRIFEMPHKVTAIEIKISEPAQAPVLRRVIEKTILGGDLVAQDWTQTNRNLIIALGMQKKVLFVILMVIVGVAALLIATNLIILIMEKRRDIAILKAMGAFHSQVLAIFISQGLVLGALGAALGCGAGIAISLNLVGIVEILEGLFGIRFLPPDVYYISEFTTKVELGDVSLIVAATLVVSLVSSFFPALHAARMRPVDVLRHE